MTKALYKTKNSKEYLFEISDLIFDNEKRQKLSLDLLKQFNGRNVCMFQESDTKGYFAFCEGDNKLFLDYEITKKDSPFNLNQAKIKSLKVSTNNPQDLDPINQILQKYI
jgi:flavodoxin